MLDDLAKTVVQKCSVRKDRPLLVGVSGGADSICLLDTLHRLGYPLLIAHFNHGIRPEAGRDEAWVRALGQSLKVEVLVGSGDVLKYARTHSQPIEESARVMRYRFMFDQAESRGTQAVAVAHHADDQVETLLMHLLRGSGLDGLIGMAYRSLPNPWSETIPLVRPLLGVWKEGIQRYCQEQGLTTLFDETNLDTTYTRNRIRHQLVPVLEALKPGVRTGLLQMMDLLKADHAVIQERVDLAWNQVVTGCSPGAVSFHQQLFDRQPLGIQRHLIRRAVIHCRSGPRDLEYRLVERVLSFIHNPTRSGQADIGLGLRIVMESGRYILAAWGADLPPGSWPQVTHPDWLDVPGEMRLGGNWVLRAEVQDDVQQAWAEAKGNQDPYRAWIDHSQGGGALYIRGRQPGERFEPLGMQGKGMKLSDFMINSQMPRRARDQWPLVILGEAIVWIPGYRVGHTARLKGSTTRVVRLELEQLD